ncbi:2654_t:CDS:2 [Scutellospora calospora]|uniref:2654_t:CDS:1 n=1 Tax=Scutellospora calospora TaxID=85575 RepID=A0ACA9JV16_9GLOM|nr:2654_t:CDS:2 [Scutellospora calospora]
MAPMRGVKELIAHILHIRNNDQDGYNSGQNLNSAGRDACAVYFRGIMRSSLSALLHKLEVE